MVTATAGSTLERELAPWSELSGLASALRAAGLEIDLTSWRRVHGLLLRLADRGRLPAPTDARALLDLLAPILCRSREERALCAAVLDAWCAGHGTVAEAAVRPSSRRDGGHVRALVRRRRVAVAVAVAAALAASIAWFEHTPSIQVSERVGGPPPSPSLGGELVERGQSTEWLSLTPRAAAPRALPPPQLDAVSEAWVARARIGLVALPGVLVLAVLLGLLAFRRWVVDRDRALSKAPEPREISLGEASDGLFESLEVARALRMLHRPVPQPTRALDGVATAQASARAAGFFTPVHRTRRAVPPVLLLHDRARPNDLLAGLALAIAQRLAREGLVVERYAFEGAPQVLWSASGERTDIDVLARDHEDARLVVIGEAGALLDLWGQRRLPWTRVFETWPQRGWLAVGEAPGRQRALLTAGGFEVAPLSGPGLLALLVRLAAGEAPRAYAVEPSLPPLLARARWREPERDAPDATLCADLIGALYGYLGARGFLLFAAMACYPALHWGLARALDLTLEARAPGGRGAHREPIERRLLRIAQLPWCREGRLPTWLRRELQGALQRDERRRIKAAYQALLAQLVIDGRGPLRLPMDLPSLKHVAPLLPGWLSRSRDSLAARDRIFTRMVLGRLPSLLEVELPRWFERRLGLGVLASFVLPLLIALSLAALGAWSVQRWMAEAPLLALAEARQRVEFAAVPLRIAQQASAGALGAALRTALPEHGFSAPPAPEALADDGEAQPRAAGDTPAQNTVRYAPEAARAAVYVAGLLEHGAWGAAPRLEAVPGLTGIEIALQRPTATGSVFRDALSGRRLLLPQTDLEPEMILLPGGTFSMGCVSGLDCYDDERPVHEVTVAPFALARTEVTFEAYDRFADATGRERPADAGWGRGDRPVIYVSWADASAYARWLSEQSGRAYRLPSEAEWEFAARAGTTTRFSTGDCIDASAANFDDRTAFALEGCPSSQVYRQQNLGVRSLPANLWGLFALHGNVQEWVADCWHENYEGAPANGEPWLSGGAAGCGRRVLRGGAWDDGPQHLRSADRYWGAPDEADGSVGFRLARAP